MSRIRRIAATVTLLDGAWGIVVGAFWVSLFPSTPHLNNSGIDYAMLIVGALLILDSALCFMGFSGAYYVSALVSVLMLVFVPSGIQLDSPFLVSVLLTAITVALDAIAANSKDYILERDHPLNLPVFG